jgi:hypothetical protein
MLVPVACGFQTLNLIIGARALVLIFKSIRLRFLFRRLRITMRLTIWRRIAFRFRQSPMIVVHRLFGNRKPRKRIISVLSAIERKHRPLLIGDPALFLVSRSKPPTLSQPWEGRGVRSPGFHLSQRSDDRAARGWQAHNWVGPSGMG